MREVYYSTSSESKFFELLDSEYEKAKIEWAQGRSYECPRTGHLLSPWFKYVVKKKEFLVLLDKEGGVTGTGEYVPLLRYFSLRSDGKLMENGIMVEEWETNKIKNYLMREDDYFQAKWNKELAIIEAAKAKQISAGDNPSIPTSTMPLV